MKTQNAKFVTIAKQIRSGTYKRKTVIDLRDFFVEVSPGKWSPNPDTRIQVRDTDRSLAFIDQIYNTIIATGDASLLDDIVVVYFKETDEAIILQRLRFDSENMSLMLLL